MKFSERKQQRRREAEERNNAWRKMPPKTQLESLNKRKLTATKQRARIARLLES